MDPYHSVSLTLSSDGCFESVRCCFCFAKPSSIQPSGGGLARISSNGVDKSKWWKLSYNIFCVHLWRAALVRTCDEHGHFICFPTPNCSLPLGLTYHQHTVLFWTFVHMDVIILTLPSPVSEQSSTIVLEYHGVPCFGQSRSLHHHLLFSFFSPLHNNKPKVEHCLN